MSVTMMQKKFSKSNQPRNDFFFQKYIKEVFNKLEELSGCKYDKVLYDSDYDYKDNFTFRNAVLNHQHLYFIVVDMKERIFGHYHSSLIDKKGDEHNYRQVENGSH